VAARLTGLHRPSSSPSSPPSSSPSAARLWKGGKTPMRVGGGGRPLLALLPLLLNPPAPQGRAKSRGCPSWVRPGGRGGAACPFCASLDTEAWRGGKRVLPFPGPARFARGRAQPLGVRAGWATRPCPAPRAGVARPAAR
jgi:hypothetical protein